MPPAVPVAADRGELERQHGTPIRRPLSDSRRTALAGLTRAWTVPQFSATVDVNVDQLIRARDRLVGRSGADLPIEALLIRLALPALDEFPSMNAMLDGGEVVLFDHRHVGFTCATGDGLLVPVARWADRQSLEDLGQAVADLAERAARHRLQPGEVGGQTFTVTDAGALGVKSMTPILPLATTAIVAYGEPQRMVRMLGDAPREVPIMTVTGTFDHRVIDGVEAARFLTTIGAYLEDPILAFAA
jgi:pyruvate dehydrogenase E2 component (dihydrolipoamide acetyltransferase)